MHKGKVSKAAIDKVTKEQVHHKLISLSGTNSIGRVSTFLISSAFILIVIFLLSGYGQTDDITIIEDGEAALAAINIASLDNEGGRYQFIKSKYDAIILKIKSVWFSVFTNHNKNHVIVVHEGKYEPNKITIQRGETITFKTKDDKSFWPASSLHPEHTVYPEFDPLMPIEPGDTWSFTFEKVGVWGFHDHLRPFLRGEITVVSKGDESSDIDCMTKIELGENVDKAECWEFTLAKVVEEDGAQEAFKLFSHLYETQPQFAQDGCHWYAHKIGDAAYADYLSHKDFDKVQFPDESSYCGYGYYHGFLEHYLRDNPDFDNAVNICDGLIKTRSEDLPRIRLNCFHAIGHGFIMEPSDTGIWGDAQAFMEPGLNACRKVVKDDERIECLQGAFNVISDWIYTDQYGLTPNPEDPMELCREQENYEEELACYYELSMKLTPYTKDGVLDFYNSYVRDIEDDRIADEIINPLLAAMVQDIIFEDDHLPLLYECRSLPERVQVSCLKGITGGFVAHGEPEEEYIKGINFCSSPVLTVDEKNICYWNIVRTFKGIYTDEVMDKVCPLIETDYQHYCELDYGL